MEEMKNLRPRSAELTWARMGTKQCARKALSPRRWDWRGRCQCSGSVRLSANTAAPLGSHDVTFPWLQSLPLCYLFQSHCSVSSCSRESATGSFGAKNIPFINTQATSEDGDFWKGVGFKPRRSREKEVTDAWFGGGQLISLTPCTPAVHADCQWI